MQLDEQAVEGIIRLAGTLEQGIARKKPDLLHSFAQPVKVAESWLDGPVEFSCLPPRPGPSRFDPGRAQAI